MPERQFYFEVHFQNNTGPFAASYWQRQPGVFPSFITAQDAAILNDRRPYRIKSEVKQPTEPANA